MSTQSEYLLLLADQFDSALRTGADLDYPEGARTVMMSDTLLREIARQCRALAAEEGSEAL